MNFSHKKFSRRKILKYCLGSLGTILASVFASSALGKVCGTQRTPTQTIGPFFPDEGDEVYVIREILDRRLPIWGANDNDLTFVKGNSNKAKGQIIYIKGRVLTQEKSGCVEVPEAVVIMWNASTSGRYNHKGDTQNYSFIHPRTHQRVERAHDKYFQYWGKHITDKTGNYCFKTIIPGFYPIDSRRRIFRPPHLHFLIMAPRKKNFVTQLYFKGDAIKDNTLIQKLNAEDFILRDDRLSRKEQESLIIEYTENSSEKFKDGLVGEYNFIIPA